MSIINMPIEKPTPKIVKKGWGHEEIWANTPEYCGKLLCFRSGAESSLHLHRNKTETWRCMSGGFMVTTIDPVTAKKANIEFLPGEVIHLPRMTAHRLACIKEGVVLEVSTFDDQDDNYRVAPGDSQAVDLCTYPNCTCPGGRKSSAPEVVKDMHDICNEILRRRGATRNEFAVA